MLGSAGAIECVVRIDGVDTELVDITVDVNGALKNTVDVLMDCCEQGKTS